MKSLTSPWMTEAFCRFLSGSMQRAINRVMMWTLMAVCVIIRGFVIVDVESVNQEDVQGPFGEGSQDVFELFGRLQQRFLSQLEEIHQRKPREADRRVMNPIVQLVRRAQEASNLMPYGACATDIMGLCEESAAHPNPIKILQCLHDNYEATSAQCKMLLENSDIYTCAASASKFCSSVQNVPELASCILDHRSSLSQECQSKIAAISPESYAETDKAVKKVVEDSAAKKAAAVKANAAHASPVLPMETSAKFATLHQTKSSGRKLGTSLLTIGLLGLFAAAVYYFSRHAKGGSIMDRVSVASPDVSASLVDRGSSEVEI